MGTVVQEGQAVVGHLLSLRMSSLRVPKLKTRNPCWKHGFTMGPGCHSLVCDFSPNTCTPLFFHPPRMPDPDFTVRDVKLLVGKLLALCGAQQDADLGRRSREGESDLQHLPVEVFLLSQSRKLPKGRGGGWNRCELQPSCSGEQVGCGVTSSRLRGRLSTAVL